MKISSQRFLGAVIALLLVLAPAGACRAGVVYLAVGDSLTFGIDPSTPSAQAPSFADQGFVHPLADALASRNGGVRPTVLNLAIAGELSTTFFSATPPPGWTLREPAINLNYPNDSTPQNSIMISSINAIHAGGNSVGYVSFVIGSNDIFYLLGTPAFQAASAADQQAMIAATIGAVQNNYLTTLFELATLAPEAKIILPIYYNPYPTFAPEHALYDAILSGFRALVQGDAFAFGATAVDLGPAFLGHELALTNIAGGDVHPNQAGYGVIAGTLAAAVPEPSSLTLVALGGLALTPLVRRRRRPA